MDLLVEKLDGSRYYLSQYKVLITDFEESAPSVARNNKQLNQRNGNIDFGGWHTDKTINITGYYRADDIDEEEMLREKLYALLSDPNGYYITQLKTTPNVAMERPGETSGNYYDKLKDYPSHKRFLVYTEAPEVELVGNVNGTLLYKLTAEFKTMKLPYGETPVRNVVLNDNKISAVGTNLLRNSRGKFQPNRSATDNYVVYSDSAVYMTQGQQYTLHADASSGLVWSGTHNNSVENNNVVLWLINSKTYGTVNAIISDANTGTGTTFTWNNPSGTYYLRVNTYQPNNSGYVENVKIEKGSKATDWCPNPEDPEYNSWRYSLTGNVCIPYSGTVPCNQLEQQFAIELTAMGGASSLSFKIDDTEFTYSGGVASGDVFLLTGFSYTQNGLSIVSKTNKAYFVLQPDKPNRITCNVPGTVKIFGFQNLYA